MFICSFRGPPPRGHVKGVVCTAPLPSACILHSTLHKTTSETSEFNLPTHCVAAWVVPRHATCARLRLDPQPALWLEEVDGTENAAVKEYGTEKRFLTVRIHHSPSITFLQPHATSLSSQHARFTSSPDAIVKRRLLRIVDRRKAHTQTAES